MMKKYLIVTLAGWIVAGTAMATAVVAYNKVIEPQPTEESIVYVNFIDETPEVIPEQETVEQEVIPLTVNDTNNYIYPYNTVSADWGAEPYESGFKYYEIPEAYVRTGGCFPEAVQIYLWSLCQEYDINYYVVVAQIERESGYKWNATGDSGKSKGYMQIQERLHKDRMAEESVTDLYDPYGNIRVGLNLLRELKEKSNGDYHYMLMSYNMGEGGCKKRNREGVYSTAYSRGVLQRAQEIEQEIQG